MKFDSSPKILHCAHLVGGQSICLARAERALGAESKAVSWQQSVFGYEADEILWPARAGLLTQELIRWRLFLRAMGNFDVIHYNYGAPILNWGALDGRHRDIGYGIGGLYADFNKSIELPLLKKIGKVIAVTYQGDDARQGDFSRLNYEYSIAQEVNEFYYSSNSDDAKRERIKIFGAHADVIYALNPDLLQVLPAHAEFLPYAHINLGDWRCPPSSVRSKSTPPLVVHAPSHRGAKGTKYILDAVKRLHAEGVKFEFRLVEGMSQVEARKIYEEADLVIDQLLAGWYGGFSVEVMALEKPVICYLRHSDFDRLPAGMADEIPIIEASPLTIKSVLGEWVQRSPTERHERGRQGRHYVEKWHNPIKIAARVLADYQRALTQKGFSRVRD